MPSLSTDKLTFRTVNLPTTPISRACLSTTLKTLFVSLRHMPSTTSLPVQTLDHLTWNYGWLAPGTTPPSPLKGRFTVMASVSLFMGLVNLMMRGGNRRTSLILAGPILSMNQTMWYSPHITTNQSGIIPRATQLSNKLETTNQRSSSPSPVHPRTARQPFSRTQSSLV